MVSKVAKFLRLSWHLKLLLINTTLLAAYSYFLFKFFKSNARFDNLQPRKFKEILSTQQLEKIKEISWSVATVANIIGWENVCRHQAYQACKLLKFYYIPFEVYIGFKKGEEGKTTGHVWTMANQKIVTGFCLTNEYFIFAKHQG